MAWPALRPPLLISSHTTTASTRTKEAVMLTRMGLCWGYVPEKARLADLLGGDDRRVRGSWGACAAGGLDDPGTAEMGRYAG